MSKKLLWILLIVIAVAGVGWYFFGRGGDNKAQYFTTAVQKGDIRAQVEATGTINAVITVQVGSQVSGTIQKLTADFNSQVRKGQVIAQIDQSLFQGALLQAQADLENARANLAASKANLEKAKAAAVQTRADYDRTVPLAREGVVSQQQLDLAKANTDSAVAAVSAGDATVKQAAAQVQQREAALSVAKTNLDHTIITAPIDGTVTNRAVDIGQTVAASLQAPTLFTIAQDLTKMQVYAKTDESDVGRIRPGQPVTFRVDAFPNQTFRGQVSQVRMNATVVQNVVTYDTIIDFDNPDRKLFPGMTAYVTIPVATALDVLRIPNGALRYKPDLSPSELKAMYQRFGIQMGGRNGGESAEEHAAPKPQPSDPSGTVLAAGRSGAPEGKGAGGWNKGGGNWANGGGRTGKDGRMQGGDASKAGAAPATAMQNVMPQVERARTAVVWKLLPDKTLLPVQVKIGITDFTMTEMVSGELKEGDELVTSSTSTRATGPPRMGAGGPGGGAPRR